MSKLPPKSGRRPAAPPPLELPQLLAHARAGDKAAVDEMAARKPTSEQVRQALDANIDKVCIVGFRSRQNDVPWGELGWECWGFNEIYRIFRPEQFPYTRFFELHLRSYFEAWEWKRHAKFLSLFVRSGMPVYLPGRSAAVPGATPYPKAAVEALAPHGRYHAGSFDWMVALAILLGAKQIRITGVDFSFGGEPISGRACLEYWIGVAEGRGIPVEVVGPTDVLRIFSLVREDTQYGFAPWKLVRDHTADAKAELAAGRKLQRSYVAARRAFAAKPLKRKKK